MKQICLLTLLLVVSLLTGCSSSEDMPEPAAAPTVGLTPPSTTTALSGQPLLLQGTFVNNVHPTSGTVQVLEKDGKRLLSFTNFSTDGGPDLRIYLAENTGLRNFIEVSRLEKSGTFTVDLPGGADPLKQRYVLIWCKAFSVLFGSAELK